MMHRAVRGFVIGSSLPATIWPLAGLGFAGRNVPVGTLDWFFIGLFFPLLFGLTNALVAIIPGETNRRWMLGAGAAMGLVSASIGTFIFNIPEVVYGLHGSDRYLALLGGPLFYGLVWALPVYRLNCLFAQTGASERLHDARPDAVRGGQHVRQRRDHGRS